MNSIRKFQPIINVNINKFMKCTKSFSTIDSKDVKVVGEVKDMSIHGLCLDSLKISFNNFKNYILKNNTVKLPLGRWNVEKVSADWEKKSRYY